MDAVKHDKKKTDGAVKAVYVPEIGSFEIKETGFDSLQSRLEKYL